MTDQPDHRPAPGTALGPPARTRAVPDDGRGDRVVLQGGTAVALQQLFAGADAPEPLLAALKAKGVDFGHVTLHVGAGTFQPVRADDLKDHVMHREWLNVGAELVQQVRRTREAGGRVIGVGTTVVRALESAMREGELLPFAGETQIFITPGYRIRSVDAMVTNFHLPESTLLMMISAFAGKERVFEAYQHAIEQRYRFFSYGDAMLLFPQAG